MIINFENLNSHSKEELIQIVEFMKHQLKEESLKVRIATDCFKAFRASINQSLDNIKKEFNETSSMTLIKLTGKKR
jgi:16S rRNA C1402 N4-methylase RsmH